MQKHLVRQTPKAWGFHVQGLCEKWEQHLYLLLSSQFTKQGQSTHFPVLWTLLTQAQQNQALFFCKGSIWFQVIKEKPRTYWEQFDKHLGGHREGTVSLSSPAVSKAHVLQLCLFRVLVHPEKVDPALWGSCTELWYFCPNPGLKWRAEMRWSSTHSHTNTVNMCPKLTGSKCGIKALEADKHQEMKEVRCSNRSWKVRETY